MIRNTTVKSSAAAKTQRLPFIYDETPCGLAAAVVSTDSENDGHRLVHYFFILLRLHN